LKVLVVDDDDSVRNVLTIALSVEDEVGEVRTANDGNDAVRVCSEFRPDVVVLDYEMPEMDGKTAASHIRRLHPAARIVAFSGVLEGKPEWADDYLLKGSLPDFPFLARGP
jgi:chemotaxis response regulator CheB